MGVTRIFSQIPAVGAQNAFTIFQADFGGSLQPDSPTDTITFTSSDGSIDITASPLSDTINFTVDSSVIDNGFWSTSGNAALSTPLLGTTDDEDFHIIANDIKRIHFDTANDRINFMGIGEAAPSITDYRLNIAGDVAVVGDANAGTPGRLLLSNSGSEADPSLPGSTRTVGIWLDSGRHLSFVNESGEGFRWDLSPTLTGSTIVSLPASVNSTNDKFLFENASAVISGKSIDGASNTITNVSLVTGVVGTLPYANGGTGATAFPANYIPFSNSSGTALTSDVGLRFSPTIGLQISPSAITGSSLASIISLSQTWNAGANTVNGIRFNVTDTASNAASTFLNFEKGGVSQFSVGKSGAIIHAANITGGALARYGSFTADGAGAFIFQSRSQLQSLTNGNVSLLNNAGTDFGLLQFGPATSSFPALKRSTTELWVRLGDDTANGSLGSGTLALVGAGGTPFVPTYQFQNRMPTGVTKGNLVESMDVTHGMTASFETTNTIMQVQRYGGAGGTWVRGASSAGNTPGFTFDGTVGNNSPTAAAMAFVASKKSAGGTGVTALANAEAAMTFGNGAAGGETNIITLFGGGNIRTPLVHNNAMTSGTAAQAEMRSGTYTPTLTNTTNIDASTSYKAQWSRIGNVVSVSGKVDIDPTIGVATATSLGISLPVASNFANAQDCAGVASVPAIASFVGAVLADTANDRAILNFVAGDPNNNSWYYCFQYEVI